MAPWSSKRKRSPRKSRYYGIIITIIMIMELSLIRCARYKCYLLFLFILIIMMRIIIIIIMMRIIIIILL